MRTQITLLAGTVWALAFITQARAQMTMPAAKPPSGEELFKRQCSTCHTVNAADPQRQGPTLAGVFGRKAGTVSGFHYSPGFAKADWSWDEAHLDPVISGAIMPYKQAKPEVRAAIIGYLKDLR